MRDTVIHVEHLSKSYQYGAISHGTLTKDLQSWWARAHGQGDPNAILTHSARSGQSGAALLGIAGCAVRRHI
jgi:lipopolysaccharide transport system ATP-binding protein